VDTSIAALAFDHQPEPIAILVGGLIRHRNRAWVAKFGASTDLDACFVADAVADIARACTEARREPTNLVVTSLREDGAQLRCSLWSAGAEAIALRAEEIQKPSTTTPTCDEILASPEKALYWVFRQMDALLWTTRKDGVCTISQGRALAHYHLTDGQLVGANLFQIYPPDSDALKLTNKTLAGETSHEMANDGAVIWNRFALPLRDPSGDVVAMVGFNTVLDKSAEKSKYAERLLDIVNDLPLVVWAMNPEGICTLSTGRLLEQMGIAPGYLVGKNLFEMYQSRPDFIEYFHRALAGESFTIEEPTEDKVYRSHYSPEKDVFGKVVGIYSVTQDITEIRLAENEARENERRLVSQARALAEAISPIIEVWQGVLVVPLIGTLEQSRASLLTGKLLDEVVRRGATFTILDLTGVDDVDSETANHLFQIMRSVELLGCSCLVSGIRGSVAQTMVSLDVPMQARTYPTLAGALRSCIRKAKS